MGLTASNERRPTFYFVGDSITENGSDVPTGGFIALMQREYVRSVDMVNRGLAGYTTKWVMERALATFEHELATQFQASFVTIWLGANDAALPDGPAKNQHVPLDEYRTNLTTLVHTLGHNLEPKARLLLMTPPTVIDATRTDKDRSNAVTGEYARACVDVAKAENVAVLDLYTYFMTKYPTEAERAPFFIDGLHLSNKGNAIVAQLLDAKIDEIFDASEVDRFHRSQIQGWRECIDVSEKNKEERAVGL